VKTLLEGARTDVHEACEQIRGLAQTYSAPDVFNEPMRRLNDARGSIDKAVGQINAIENELADANKQVADQRKEIAELKAKIESAPKKTATKAPGKAKAAKADQKTGEDQKPPETPKESQGDGTNGGDAK
jgi:predicted  nucleic acid-binding Zn-ribbon protein